MKISIITFHNTSNFGATLQCTALSEYLRNRGHEVEVVNYLPYYVRDKKSITKELRNVSRSKNKIKGIIKGIAYLAHFKALKQRDARFEKFISNNLCLTPAYYTIDQIMKNPPQADLYICGSDQIWNPALTGNSLDLAFFLQFTDGRKASYGASVGEFDIEANKEELLRLTKDFVAVSVRENSVAERLSKAINRDVKMVLDCTLLLRKDNYSKMENRLKLSSEPYLLVYEMQRSAVADKAIKIIAKEKNLKIIDISPNPFISHKGAKRAIGIGPGEFLTLMKHAEYVVTNSFHGTVFSVLYEKQFLSIPHNTRSGRMVDFLSSLNLENRLISDIKDIPTSVVDYHDVRSALEELRMSSYEFINGLI